MSVNGSETEEATEHTALMDGHIAEARPDRVIAERIAKKRKTKSDNQRSYGVSNWNYSYLNWCDCFFMFTLTYD